MITLTDGDADAAGMKTARRAHHVTCSKTRRASNPMTDIFCIAELDMGRVKELLGRVYPRVGSGRVWSNGVGHPGWYRMLR